MTPKRLVPRSFWPITRDREVTAVLPEFQFYYLVTFYEEDMLLAF
jgi:hypothetical protein